MCPVEYADKMDNYFNWFVCVLRPVSRMIIKIITTKHLTGEIEMDAEEINQIKN